MHDTRRYGLLVAATLVAAACGPAEDAVDGRLEADTPLVTPISRTEACWVQVHGTSYRSQIGGQTQRSSLLGSSRFADGARLVVDGRVLTITGSGSEPNGELGGHWVSGTAPAPRDLEDHGADGRRAVACFGGGERASTCPDRMELTERYVRCGADVTLRGAIRGDTFELHDHAAEGAAAAFGIFGVTGLCIACPVVAVIGGVFVLILRLSRREKKR